MYMDTKNNDNRLTAWKKLKTLILFSSLRIEKKSRGGHVMLPTAPSPSFGRLVTRASH